MQPSSALSMRALFLAALAALAAPAQAVTVYDAAAGTLPSAQGWSSLQAGAAPAQLVAAGVYRLDTPGAGLGIFGNAIQSPVVLDTSAGFDLAFTLRIADEIHTSANRAGYSVLVTGSDARRAIEIAFWLGNVWIYDYVAGNPDRLVHGSDVAFDASVSHDYSLVVRAGQFSLKADGEPLLAGALRDYTAAGPPYSVPNGLFFGDDTSRGSSVSELSLVRVTPVPEPATPLLAVAGLLWLGWRRMAVAGARLLIRLRMEPLPRGAL